MEKKNIYIYMIITSPKKKTYITITAWNIEQKSQIKYLGVFIDEHLKMGCSPPAH